MKLKIKITKNQFDNWLIALRSGDYIQSAGYLKLNTDSKITYCCLGVLCETLGYESTLVDKSSIMQFCYNVESNALVSLSLPPKLVETTFFNVNTQFTNESGLLPPIKSWSLEQKTKFSKVIDIMKIKTVEDGDINIITLASLNDFGLFDFKYIADLIEEFLEPSL